LAKADFKIVVFLGAPGAGKGTQAALVAQEMHLVHLSSGDLFRHAVECDDELGQKVKAYMERGVLVPDEITIQMVLDRLLQFGAQNGVILDGFPRNLVQAESLDKALSAGSHDKVDLAVYISVAQSQLIKRLSSRWLCRQCQAPYNHDESKGATHPCGKCGGELYQRPDDVPETVQKRLEVYFRDTMPLIEYYKQRGTLVEVDGNGDAEDIALRIVRAIGDSK